MAGSRFVGTVLAYWSGPRTNSYGIKKVLGLNPSWILNLSFCEYISHSQQKHHWRYSGWNVTRKPIWGCFSLVFRPPPDFLSCRISKPKLFYARWSVPLEKFTTAGGMKICTPINIGFPCHWDYTNPFGSQKAEVTVMMRTTLADTVRHQNMSGAE